MQQRCAIFSCLGLGDGLIILTLAQNLYLNGYRPVLFHPFLQELQSWFPHLPIHPFPKNFDALHTFDRFFFVYERLPHMLALQAHCEAMYPEKTMVLNPIATPNRDYPYWEVGRFDGDQPYLDNLVRFCKMVLQLKETTKSNGLVLPEHVKPRRYMQRIAIHPTSSLERKNWPKKKFLRLAQALEKRGFETMFVLREEERKGWDGVHAPRFSSIEEMARAVAESGYMIGNDSGIGHLASCCGVPTVTICRHHHIASFWRPAWTRGDVIAPYKWILNIKGLRLRNACWKRWISVRRVLRIFYALQGSSSRNRLGGLCRKSPQRSREEACVK